MGIPAPAGVATAGTISGVIYLGFEACVGLTPGPESQYLPPAGPERDFVLLFPRGWKVVSAGSWACKSLVWKRTNAQAPRNNVSIRRFIFLSGIVLTTSSRC